MNKGVGGINNEIGTEKILIDASIGGNTAVQIMDKTPIRFKKLMKECFLNRIGVDNNFFVVTPLSRVVTPAINTLSSGYAQSVTT